MKAWEFLPGNTRVVHHATMQFDTAGSSRQLDALDPEPGYEGLIPHSVASPMDSSWTGVPAMRRMSHLGQVRQRQGNTSEALKHFREAVRLAPGYVEGQRHLAGLERGLTGKAN